MRIVAALLLSLCIESDAVTQTRNIGDAVRVGSQQIGTSSCSITASNTPNLPNDQFIRAIIERTVCRGQFVTPEGVHGWTFVPISDSDRAGVIALGVQALGSLTNIADTGDSFAQLIAVRLIANIGGPDAAPPLERALAPQVWMPTRMAALYGITNQSPEFADPILRRMKLDADPKIREIATYLLEEAHR
jgi:hypothetical protein